jgi:hypothetical protein
VKGVTSSIQTQLNGKQSTLTNPVTGTGTTNYLPKFTGSTTIGNSQVFDSGTGVVIGGAATTNGFLEVIKSGSSIAQFSFGQSTTYRTDFFVDATGNFYIQPQGTTRLTLFSDGNTFIGSSPTNAGFKLDVNGTGRFSGNLSLNTSSLILGLGNGGSNEAVYFNYNSNAASRSWRIIKDWTAFGDFQIQQSTTQTGTTYADVLRFSPTGTATFSGNVGIVTSTPSAVKPTTTFGWASNLPSRVIEIAPDNSALNGANAGLFLRNNNATTGFDLWSDNFFGDCYLDNRYNGIFIFRNNTNATATERMRITLSGNVLIGSPPAADNGARLQLSSSGSTAQTITGAGSGSYSSISFNNTTTGYGFDIGFGGSTTIAPNSFYIYGGSTPNVKFLITSGGNVGIGNSTPAGKLSVNDSTYGEYLRIVSGLIGGNETSVYLAWNNAGSITLKQVTVGAADSGGTGFRLLRIPNT